MGVPLSSYTVLKYIAESSEIGNSPQTRQSIEMELALDSLKEYSVFAFIIHDPLVHQEFHNHLEKQFQRLHYSSGKNLVFFGLVDSPKKLSLVGERPFYQDIRDMVTSYEDEENKNDNLSYSAFAIANSLEINQEMLPAIIVTHDTRLSSYRYYKTCPNELERQFSRLTGISNQMNIRKQNSNLSLVEKQAILYELLDIEDLELCNGMGESKLTESLARALSDIMSFLVPDGYGYNERYVKKIAVEQKNTSIKKVIKSLENLKRNIEPMDKEEIENHHLFSLIEELNIKLAIFLKMYHEDNLPPMLDTLSIKKEWLDQHTWQLLRTGIAVSNFLQINNASLDYSPSVICLAKMFEQEINNSFVHWLRKENAIQLPQYYNKVQPNVRALVTTNFRSKSTNIIPVDLNKSHYGSWHPPELGKSMNLAIYNVKENDFATMGINKNTFLEEWRKIHSIRNKAAHTDEVRFGDFKALEKSLVKIADNHVLEKLSLMKKEFKGVID